MVFLICLLLIASISSVNAEADDDAVNVLSLSKDGITINYPSDWQSSRSTSDSSIMAIAKTDAVDSLGVAKVSINVEKKAIDGDLSTYLNTTYESMGKDSSFELVSSGAIVVDDIDAFEYIYTSLSEDGSQKEHKAVWVEKNGQAYALLYSAPLDQFENNLYVFDFILSDIKIS